MTRCYGEPPEPSPARIRVFLMWFLSITMGLQLSFGFLLAGAGILDFWTMAALTTATGAVIAWRVVTEGKH